MVELEAVVVVEDPGTGRASTTSPITGGLWFHATVHPSRTHYDARKFPGNSCLSSRVTSQLPALVLPAPRIDAPTGAHPKMLTALSPWLTVSINDIRQDFVGEGVPISNCPWEQCVG